MENEVVLDTYRAPWAPLGSRWSCCRFPPGRRISQHPLRSGWRSAGFPRQSQKNAHGWKKKKIQGDELRWLFLSGNVLVFRNASHLELGTETELKTGYSMDFISFGFSFMAWLHWEQLPWSEVSRGKQTTVPGSSAMIQRQDETEAS